MSKRESPIGLFSILGATFGLSIAGIWLAYQLGFGSHPNTEYTYIADTNNTSVKNEANIPSPILTSTPTSTPKKLKTPLQVQVKFLVGSNTISSQGVETLNQLEKQIVEFDPQNVGIRVFSNPGESDLSQETARQRGEEIAGYLRDLGLKHKIVISQRKVEITANNSLVIELYKLK